jgi:hypothetical protein
VDCIANNGPKPHDIRVFLHNVGAAHTATHVRCMRARVKLAHCAARTSLMAALRSAM